MTLTVTGQAVSGIGSALVVPQHNLCLDIGVCTPESIPCPVVAITHGHQDHLYGIVQHALIRAMQKMPTPKYLMSPHLIPHVEELFSRWRIIQEDESLPKYKLIPLSAGETFPLGGGRFVRPFKTDHRVESQGYSIVERRSKLKPEYLGFSGEEIRQLKLKGVEVTDTVEHVELAYTGDTRASVVDTVEDVRKARKLVIESTFLCEETAQADFATKRGHIHLKELEARADKFENETIMLVHFSNRYDNEMIARRLASLPNSLGSRTTFLRV